MPTSQALVSWCDRVLALQCLDPSWYLAVDMQLFLLALPLV